MHKASTTEATFPCNENNIFLQNGDKFKVNFAFTEISVCPFLPIMQSFFNIVQNAADHTPPPHPLPSIWTFGKTF